MRYYILTLLALLSWAPASAASEAQEIAAVLFERIAPYAGNRQADTFLSNMARITKPSKEEMAIYRHFFNETLQSDEFRTAWVKVVAKRYTLEELRQIREVSEHPGFKAFLAKFRDLDEELMEARAEIERRRMPELKKRIAAVKEKK